MMSKTNQLLIKTPEGIVFSQLLASPLSRFVAWAIDVAAILAVATVVGSLCGVLGIVSLDLAQALSLILYFAISIGYGILLEWYWRGQTIGKKLLRLRVVDAQGLRLHFSQVAVRNLLRFIDMFPAFYLVGGVACFLSRRGQRLGDLAANTIVVRHPRIREPDLDQILAGKFNSLREHAHLAARLRQRVSPAEAGLALQALLRRDLLEPAARVTLFQSLAAHFKMKVEFPLEAIDGIADEQYVRNLVDVLYRSRTGSVAIQSSKPAELLPYERR